MLRVSLVGLARKVNVTKRLFPINCLKPTTKVSLSSTLHTVDGRNTTNQFIWRICHYIIQGFILPRWLFGISEPSTVASGCYTYAILGAGNDGILKDH